jgi:hypothetical protein
MVDFNTSNGAAMANWWIFSHGFYDGIAENTPEFQWHNAVKMAVFGSG